MSRLSETQAECMSAVTALRYAYTVLLKSSLSEANNT